MSVYARISVQEAEKKAIMKFFNHRADVVAIDFLGHGDSPAPNNPQMYTADEVCFKENNCVFIKFFIRYYIAPKRSHRGFHEVPKET